MLGDRPSQVRLVLGLDRVGGVVGEGAVELHVQESARRAGARRSRGRPARPCRSLRRPPPLAGRAARCRRSERRCSMYSSAGRRCSTVARGTVGAAPTPVAAIARISRRPLSSPTGAAPGRQSFSPLYWGGLWLAVNIAPGSVEAPGGEIHHVGRGQAEVDDVAPGARSRPRRRPRTGPATRAGSRGPARPGRRRTTRRRPPDPARDRRRRTRRGRRRARRRP